MIQHGILIELSFSVKINNIPSHCYTETVLSVLYVLGKRENQKQIDDGSKIALEKPSKTIFLEKFVSLS